MWHRRLSCYTADQGYPSQLAFRAASTALFYAKQGITGGMKKFREVFSFSPPLLNLEPRLGASTSVSHDKAVGVAPLPFPSIRYLVY